MQLCTPIYRNFVFFGKKKCYEKKSIHEYLQVQNVSRVQFDFEKADKLGIRFDILKALVETIYDKYCAPKLNSISFLLDNSSSFRCRLLTLDS